ncbi:hypothetical protein PRIPAC_92551 [Pristionchus pacificus]|uniref:Uncharacterized protein n=1 Tax=Pristionchus pacificus TaxID=54126 RepID=A0A454Y3V9_PRIPA|nr:hypothetical protein PRIPAC_92551 [Pristionchus pacificus]|eukprot:PDM68255.1 hypothetical protein PRIPAC_46299 [Pristionchus pacificus]
MSTAPMAKRARFNNYSAPGRSYGPRNHQFDSRIFNSNSYNYSYPAYPEAMPKSALPWLPIQPVHRNPVNVTIQQNFVTNDIMSFVQRSIETIKAAKVSSPPIEPKVEEIITRAQALSLFDMKLLKTRKSSVITSLLSTPSLCERCGLHNIPKDQKEKHDDWHVKKNIEEMKRKKEGELNMRVLYPSAQSWVNTVEHEVTGQLVCPKDKVVVTVNEIRSPPVVAKPSMTCSDDTSKNCCECMEEFKLYFDDDDDEWKMRDCVEMEDGEVYHSECARNHVNDADVETRRMWSCIQSTSA